MALKDRLIKNSTIKNTALLRESKDYLPKDCVSTKYPLINIALYGSLDGGLPPGYMAIAGPSKHFKTGFSLLLAKAFQEKYDDGIVLFYDSERGAPPDYFNTFGVDIDRVIHTPINNLEEFKFDITNQLDEITEEDHVMIIVDSMGGLASRKELQDAMDQKSVQDMTRPKEMKSIFRHVLPALKSKDVPMIGISHTYQTMEMYSKDVVSGGTGQIYAADTVWIIGRRKQKDGKEVEGYNFTIKVDKSRFVKEESKFPITVTWEHGIYKHSGLLELALIHGSVIKPNMGWYAMKSDPEKKYREKQLLENDEFWNKIFETTNFKEWIEQTFKARTSGAPINVEEFDENKDNSPSD